MHSPDDPTQVGRSAELLTTGEQDLHADANDAVREVLFRFTLGLRQHCPTPQDGNGR